MYGSRDPLLKFWNPLISPEKLELQTSIWHRDGWQWVLTKKV